MRAAVSRVIEIYTDGACRGNPGPGGWAALLRYNGHEKTLYGAEPHTTNNRMELLAVIKALEAIRDPRHPLVITTDSRYVKDGITQWLAGWKRRNWRTAGRKPVKNQDLWQRLDELAGRFDIEWRWVRGHSGHRENERVDRLANRAIDEMLAERRA